MVKTLSNPNVVFEASWEVCNKVGGIYTVLSTHANTLMRKMKERLIFVGPDLCKDNPLFVEDKSLYRNWVESVAQIGVNIRIGRWKVLGEPIVILVDFFCFYDRKNSIYNWAWEHYGVDSLHAYGDYDEASMFSYASGVVVAHITQTCLSSKNKIIYHAHEWMTGLGLLYIKEKNPLVSTVFTTHATSIGRSIAGNDKLLYAYFEGYNGDQMARELNMESKHSIEKIAAHEADCFTTVSNFTARECVQLLDINPQVILPNGFDKGFVPKGREYTSEKRKVRAKIIDVASKLMGYEFADNTLVVSTSGRNDFRCKGFDVYLEALKQLNETIESDVLALIEVPCWCVGAREDLQQRLYSDEHYTTPLEMPILTHKLNNLKEDRIVNLICQLNLMNQSANRVKVMLIPCYLDGKDGIFNMEYYDLLIGNDLCVYPSYYEPWGYTPLESCAFKIPCVTTNLSGFGQWVEESLGKASQLADGVDVIPRTDENYFEVAKQINLDIIELSKMPKTKRTQLSRNAESIASKAQWKDFAKKYFEAYDFALQNGNLRNSLM